MSTTPKVVFLPHGNLQYSQLPPEKRTWVIENGYERLFDSVREKLRSLVQDGLLEPVCRMVFEGIVTVAKRAKFNLMSDEEPLRRALRNVTGAYVSDSRWPPAPTSPGRFNVAESIDDLLAANDAVGEAMRGLGLEAERSLYSPQLMRTQIEAIRDELFALTYFGE